MYFVINTLYKESMDKVILKNKIYKLIDFIKIPFVICPVYTLIEIISKVFNALILSFQVLIIANFIDTAVNIFNGQAQKNSIYLPLFLLMLTIIYSYLNEHLMRFVNLKLRMRMTTLCKKDIIEKRAKLQYQHVENDDTWDLISRTCGDPIEKIIEGFDNLLNISSIVIRVVSILVILMFQVLWAGVVIITISVPLFFLAIKAGKEAYEASKEAEKYRRRADYLQKVLLGRDSVEERTLFNYTDGLNNKWYEKYEAARKLEMKVDLKYYIKMKGSSIITLFISLCIIGVLLFPLSNAKITIGMFIGLVNKTLELVHAMSWELTSVMRKLVKNKEFLKDLTAFFDLSETDGALDLPCSMEDFKFENIEFKNVYFKYPNTENYILKDFSLILQKNLHYALVGINGAGKTTITKLLTGMYDNFEGEILINGKSIRDYSQSVLKGICSIVYQDFAKYYIKIKDNIALGDTLKYDEQSIYKAISIMELDNLIDNFPNGINTYLGKIKENGIDLSGGQWQRIAIARTLYSSSLIRILDEPTAALDPVAESNIYEMFSKISTEKSTIFITHRLGAARIADEIIVIDDGKVKEKGNHENLMNKGGIYAQMFESQRSWYQ